MNSVLSRRLRRRSTIAVVQRCPRVAAPDPGKPRDRHRYAQALPPGLEQTLVFLRSWRPVVQAISLPFEKDRWPRWTSRWRSTSRRPVLTGFLPAPEWRSPRRHQHGAAARSATTARSRRTFRPTWFAAHATSPCVDVPGKRAPTPRECRSNEPYVPLGTNPWYGDPNQVLSCPGARSALRPGCQSGRGVVPRAVGEQRGQSGARRSAAAACGRLRPGVIREPAGNGFGAVQWTTTQPVYVHSAEGPPGSTAVYSPTSGRGGRT